jgi:hypothetical protein
MSHHKRGSLRSPYKNSGLLWRRKGGACQGARGNVLRSKVLMSKVLWKLLGSCHKCLKYWLRERLDTRANPLHNLKAPSDKIISDLVPSSCLKLLPLQTSSLLSVSPSQGPYLNANALLTQSQSLVYHISLSHPGKMELGRVSTNESQGERDAPDHVWGTEMTVVVVKQCPGASSQSDRQ